MASQHTAVFRQEAVRVALTSGLSRKQVAADFGVHCQAGHVYMPEMGVFNVKPLDTIGAQRTA